MAITEKFVGQSLPRKEDASLLTGQGSFVDNLTLPGMLYLAVVRSPFAHARIVKVDVSKAREMPGVVGAWSGEELAGEWAGPLPMVWPITEDIKTSDHWPITKDKARFQGDGVAVVVAESRGIADDAAEVVAVEYEQLTPVLDLEEGAKDGSPLVHDELGTNAVVHWSHGGGGDQGVFDNAPVQLRLRYEAPRITPSPIEPRGALASVVPAMGEFTLWTSTQIPHIARVTLSGTTGIPEHKLRIVAPDVGGAFGAKLNVYAEEALCLALARRTGRAIKWIEERSVSYAVTTQGRGVIHDVEVAATEEGKLLGFRVKELADMGAYFQLLTPGIPELGGWVYMGPYDTQGYWYEFTGRHDEQDADGRVPRGRTARGDLRRRTRGRRARAARRQGPGRGPAHQLRAEPRGGEAVADGAEDRFGRLPAGVRAGARARGLRPVPQGAGVPS